MKTLNRTKIYWNLYLQFFKAPNVPISVTGGSGKKITWAKVIPSSKSGYQLILFLGVLRFPLFWRWIYALTPGGDLVKAHIS